MIIADLARSAFDAEAAAAVSRSIYKTAGLDQLRFFNRGPGRWRPRKGLAAKIRKLGLAQLRRAGAPNEAPAARRPADATTSRSRDRRRSDTSPMAMREALDALGSRQRALEEAHARSTLELHERFDALAAQISTALGGGHGAVARAGLPVSVGAGGAGRPAAHRAAPVAHAACTTCASSRLVPAAAPERGAAPSRLGGADR